MSNTCSLSFAPDLAALDAKIDLIDTEVDAIRAVDLPAIDTLIDTVDTEVDAIRAVDIPAIDALIDANLAAINAIEIRGTLLQAYNVVAAAVWEDIINVNGSGILHSILLENNDAGVTGDIRITVDGIPFLQATHAGVATVCIALGDTSISLDSVTLRFLPLDAGDSNNLLDIEFSTSLRVEHQASIPGAGNSAAIILYNLDGA